VPQNRRKFLRANAHGYAWQRRGQLGGKHYKPFVGFAEHHDGKPLIDARSGARYKPAVMLIRYQANGSRWGTGATNVWPCTKIEAPGKPG